MKHRLSLFLVPLVVCGWLVWLSRPAGDAPNTPAPAPTSSLPFSLAGGNAPVASEEATSGDCCPGQVVEDAAVAQESMNAAPRRGGLLAPVTVNKPESLQALADFQAWAERYASADAGERAQLVAEGRRLAQARRETFAGLIKHDPQTAIESMLPYAMRKDLPQEIAEMIEHPVRGRGPLNVIGVTPPRGQRVDESIIRTATVKEKDYRVYTYGQRLNQITTPSTPLLGVAVDSGSGPRIMALRAEPYEVLEKDEATALKRATRVKEAVCPVSGDETEAAGDETGVATGEQIVWLCSHGHIGQYLQTPDGLQLLAAGGGGTSPGTSPVVPATHNQGNKKFLALRVRFSNQAANYEPASDATMQTELQLVVDKAAEWSYGKLQSTFKFSPVLTLPQTDTWYRDNGAEDKMRDDALALAAAFTETDGTKPYNPANFDFPAIVFSTNAFGPYCGLGTIGGNKTWIKCVTASVFLHEWGHNFGLLHANAWEPTTDSPIGPGNHVEYGSRYSPMGSGWVSYNTIERYTMGWLSSGDVAQVAAGGIYRLYDADKSTLTSARPYALRIRQKDARFLFVEYRPNFREDGVRESNTDNGVLIAWTDNGSQLLDMNPLTSGGVNDAPLLIGRTFSDYGQGIYITPIGKGGATPDGYMDVVVNYEAGLSNAAPVGVLTASNLTPGTGTTINLSMQASDPDGDTLAYFWDFGDGTYSTNNLPDATKSWGTAGRYYVRCTVSDRRGREVTKSVVIRVGNPGNGSASGRVARADGSGVPNVLLRVDADHFAYTDSTGAYTITRLNNGGNYTINAMRDGWTFTPQFANPVALTGDVANLNFTTTAAPTYGGVSGEMWTGITGGVVANLTASTAYQNNTPTYRYLLADEFEAPEGIDDNYGQRVRGFFKAPTTGNYFFYIASDDASELWLSTNEDPATKTKIATVTTWVNSRTYNAQANQKSAAIALTAGQRYYIEALHKEGGGGDHLSVAVDLPSGTQLRPIPASYLDPYYTVTPPAPANTVTVVATDAAASESGGNTGTFTLTRTGSTTAALTVSFDIGGTATYGSDFSATGLSATFAAGSATTTVTVTPINDTIPEPAETVVLTLAPAPARYTLGANATATVVIEDDEATQVSIAATDPLADESGSNPGVFTITRTGSTVSALTVNYTIGGSATNGSDYPTLGTSISIPAGQSSATITLAPTADGLLEVSETVVLTIASGSGYAIGTPNSATVVISAGPGTGGGILREWWDGISNTNTLYDLTNLGSYPFAPTGREIVTTAFTTGENRTDSFGERWRAIFTAPISGNYFFYIASDDNSELWLSTDATPDRRQKIASLTGSTSFQNWTANASQKSAAIPLVAGQRYYIEALFKEGGGGDHMSVGVEYPNGSLERPIPAHRLDPFPVATGLGAPWTAQDIGNTGAPGMGGVGSSILPTGPRNRYSFSGTGNAAIADGTSVADSIGGANAVLRGAGAVYNAGGNAIDLPGGAQTTQSYIDLPNGVITGTFGGGTRYTSATYEAWVTVQSVQNWSRLFDFGTNSSGEINAPGGNFNASNSQNLLLSATNATSNDQQIARRFSGGKAAVTADASGTMVIGTQLHLAVVYDAADQNWRWYRNGVLVNSVPDTDGLTTLTDVNNWLGRSNYSADANTDALYNEFRVYNYALTEAQLRGNTNAGPDVVNTFDNGLTGPYFITGSGVLSLNGNADGLHFDSQSLTGDWELRVQLNALTGPGGNAIAGLMLRDGTAANARHAFIGVTADGAARFISRPTAGGNAVTATLAAQALPQWLRLVRVGNTIAGYVSADNVTWTQVGATASWSSLPTTLQGGLAVASGTTANNAALAQFDNFTLSPLPGSGDGFLYERFEGIGGGDIASLTGAAIYPNAPTLREVRSGFFEVAGTSPNLDNFGDRLRGYFLAPLSGNYTFYIAGDDAAELWLSTSESPAGRTRIANVPGFSDFRQWTKYAAQKSSPVVLAAGQRYYLEVLHKEGGGGDHVSVGVVLPSGVAEMPMLASRVSRLVLPTAVGGPWTAAEVGTPALSGSTSVFPVQNAGVGELLPVGPRHRYSFSGTASAAAPDGTTITDRIGGQHAMVRGAGAAFDATGTGLGLPGGASSAQAYVDLPNGIITGAINGGSDYTSASYELWYVQRSNRNWCRLMDFGTNSAGEVTTVGGSFTGTNSIMVSGNINSGADMRLSRSGSSGADRDAYGATVLNQLAHVVLTYDSSVAAWKCYRNGALIAQLPDAGGLATLDDLNNWIGRSNFSADQNFDGVLQEFRIYGYALTPQQVLGNFGAGPDTVNTAQVALTKAPRHRWSFNGAASQSAPDGTWVFDTLGGANAQVRGAGASFDAAGGGVVLPGGSAATQAYVDLPNGVATGTVNGGTRYTSVTYETWSIQTAHQNWSRLWDFGTGTAGELNGPGGSASGSNYVLLAANNTTNPNPRLERKTSAATAQANLTGVTTLNQLTHQVVTYDNASQSWRWYINGVLVSTLADAEGIKTLVDVNNWLGRSQFTADANWAGSLQEFRIYDYSLSADQVLANLTTGPDGLNLPNSGLAGAVTISGSGDIASTGASDSFHFASQGMDGDGEIVARLTAILNSDASAKAGVMIRESSAPGARRVFLGLTPSLGARYGSRTATGGNATTTTLSALSSPLWLRLVRKGDVITGYTSSDGVTWGSPVGTTTLSGLPVDVLVGLAISSNNVGRAEANFASVQVIRPTVTIVASQNAAEPAQAGLFTVTRTWDTASPLTVSYGVAGTATAGVDYQTLSGSVVIPAGASTATITVTPIDDTAAEALETIGLTLVDASGYVLGARTSDTVTLSGTEGLFVFNKTTTGSTLAWSLGGNWQGGAAPASGVGALVETFTGLTLPAGTIATDAGGAYALGTLRLAGTGPAAGTTTVTLAGGGFSFSVPASAVTLDALNGAGLTYQFNAPLTLTDPSTAITGNGTASFIFSGNLSGTGGLVKSGSSTLTLTGTNNYAGATTISSGVLSVGNNTATGSLGTGAVTNQGTLRFHRSDTALTVSNVIGGSGGLQIGVSTGGTLNALTTLTGSNTFTGGVTILSGGLKITQSNALGSGSKVVTLANASAGNARLHLDGASTIVLPSTITYTTSNASGALINDAGTNTVAGNVSLGGSVDTKLVSNAGSLTLSGTIAPITTSRALILGGTGTGVISGPIQNGTGGNTLVRVDKNDAGQWTLSGTSSHTGSTNVNAGTLVVNGPITAGTGVAVASGATLAGTGTITPATTVAGTHQPGDGVGSQSFGGTLSYAATGRLKLEWGGNSAAAGTFDRVAVSSIATVANGAGVDLVFNRPGSTVNFADVFWKQSRSWTVLTAGTLTGSFTLGTVSTDSAGQNAAGYGVFAWQQNATSATVVWTPVSPAQQWAQSNFGAAWNDPEVAGSQADPDRDGLSNLLERSMNGNPNQSNPPLAWTSTANGQLFLNFTRSMDALDVTLVVQGADQPAGPWTDLARCLPGGSFTSLLGTVTVTETGTGSTRTVQVSDQYPINDTDHPRRFLRVRAQD